MMRLQPAGLGCEAESDGDVEAVEELHLPIEPAVRSGAEAVRPAQAGTQIAHPEIPHQADGLLQAVILEMKPLADAE